VHLSALLVCILLINRPVESHSGARETFIAGPLMGWCLVRGHSQVEFLNSAAENGAFWCTFHAIPVAN